MSTWAPLRLESILKPRLWGGSALRDDWGKALPTAEPYGESWELTWRPEDMNRIRGGAHDGRTLQEVASADREGLIGSRLASFPQFPLLAKLLDCRERLSLQVHPTPAYVQAHSAAEVKMEAWYVLDAPADATLILGLRPGTTRDAFATAVAAGALSDMLEEQPIRAGDVVLVRPGTVHALLEGLMVYEIQQSSDTTFRVYDWDRVDAQGHARELHVQEALECIAFDAAPRPIAAALALDRGRELLVATPAFCLERVEVESAWECAVDSSRCELLTVIAGDGIVDGLDDRLHVGDSVLIPAAIGRYGLTGRMTVLRAYMPDWSTDVWAAARAAGHDDAAIQTVCGGFGPDATLP